MQEGFLKLYMALPRAAMTLNMALTTGSLPPPQQHYVSIAALQEDSTNLSE